MVTCLVLLALLPLCLSAPSGGGGYYGQTYAEPHDGFESSVHANNARRQIQVNQNAQWYGTGTGTARKDGVPGSPLGVIGVRSHGHSGGYGQGHHSGSRSGYGGHNDGYGGAHGHDNRYGNSYHHAPSYQPYSQGHGHQGNSHGSHGYNHPSHYDPHGKHGRSDGSKYGYGFSYELNKATSYH